MSDRELLQQALDALEEARFLSARVYAYEKEIAALRTRLAQPEPEPVAWLADGDKVYFNQKLATKLSDDSVKPLYTAPPVREWQGLSADEIWDEWCEQAKPERDTRNFVAGYARAIEAKLKEKNT